MGTVWATNRRRSTPRCEVLVRDETEGFKPFNLGVELSSTSLEACLGRVSAETATGCRKVFFNLGGVRFIGINSLLFLLCCISELKRRGVSVRLRLPEVDGRWDFDEAAQGSEEERARKARDFLMRWEFLGALEEAAGDYSQVLLPHQHDYFDPGLPLRFYTEGTRRNEFGEEIRLLSNDLLEIRHMTRGPMGNRAVSWDEIVKFRDEHLLYGRFLEALAKVLGREQSDLGTHLANTIIMETLQNAFEHPRASMAMIAMARDKRNGVFVVAIADNGNTIPNTIKSRFQTSEGRMALIDKVTVEDQDRSMIERAKGPADLDDAINKYRQDAAAISYATQHGTTRKERSGESEGKQQRIGAGLYLVKTTAMDYGGSCSIRAGSAMVTFCKENGEAIERFAAASCWRGNLITVTLPLAVK